jgi:pimeloyl-ACP methyl ester carboxylesterase
MGEAAGESNNIVRREESMATFVLVHGAWRGAWCWRRVARLLTGLGERSHLLTRDINLDTHILDVVNVMKWQGLNNVVLVGHSYAGMVISGVAGKLEKSIFSFVMLDAFSPETGQALVDLQPPAIRENFLVAARNGALTIPPRPAAMFNLNEKDRAWVDAQCTPHPIKCFLQNLTLTRARERVGIRAFIRTTGYPSESFDHGVAYARAKGSRTHEVACGHDVMLDMPERLAELLKGLSP